MKPNNFIQLDRLFTSVSQEESSDESLERQIFLGHPEGKGWSDILSMRRVVILAEAGSGKTEELLSVCQKLRGTNKSAFFIRLEHLADSFEDSFDEGTADEFRTWKDSDSDCWLFLDSVDEARLKGPMDFERAIRTLSRELGAHKNRCHIYLSSRITEWRPESDLKLVSQKLALIAEQHTENANNELAPSSDIANQQHVLLNPDSEELLFEPRVFALCALNTEQIAMFCEGNGVSDAEEFLEQIVKQDALAFASRPQDLLELIEFWKKEKRIGGRFELVERYVKERIKEADPTRAQARNLSFAKAKKGAVLVAATVTLSKQSRIRIPGSDKKNAHDINELLSDWTDEECSTLLQRPIFDKAIYGTVRFHHRDVREFLTAEWILELLKRNELRTKIKRLFFKNQYGCEVIVPTMRPIAGWVAMQDEAILNQVLEVSPDILVDFGDPSLLPIATPGPAHLSCWNNYCN